MGMTLIPKHNEMLAVFFKISTLGHVILMYPSAQELLLQSHMSRFARALLIYKSKFYSDTSLEEKQNQQGLPSMRVSLMTCSTLRTTTTVLAAALKLGSN